MTAAEIAAERGNNYRLHADPQTQRIRLSCVSGNGRLNTIMFTATDALAVADALVDATERLEQ